MLQLTKGLMASAALALFMGASSAHAQFTNVLAPTDQVLVVNGQNDGDGDGGPSPVAEPVTNAVDGTVNKYLNFLDLGSGFIDNPKSGSSLVTALRIFTANDSPERDPASYILEGSHTPSGPFTLISQGALSLPTGRNNQAAGTLIDPTTQFQQTVIFPNTVSYSSYRVTFPTLRDAGAANSMQVAEVQLLTVPEPASISLLALGGLGLLARRRRA